jgi:hypothetical protein
MAAHGRPQQTDFNDYENLYLTAGAKPLQIARSLLHLRDYVNTNMNEQVNPQRINRDIRVKYLRKQITEDQFKALLKRRDKRFHFARENHQVLEMYVQSAMNIITRYNQKTTDVLFVKSIWEPFETELYTLRLHTIKCFKKIADTYKFRARTINAEFEFD